jgi:hypothetical protein
MNKEISLYGLRPLHVLALLSIIAITAIVSVIAAAAAAAISAAAVAFVLKEYKKGSKDPLRSLIVKSKSAKQIKDKLNILTYL